MPPHKLTDLALGVILPLHCHLGFSAIIIDYLPKRKFGAIYTISKTMLYLLTAGTIYGLYEYNTKDVGITEGVSRIWKSNRSKTVSGEEE